MLIVQENIHLWQVWQVKVEPGCRSVYLIDDDSLGNIFTVCLSLTNRSNRLNSFSHCCHIYGDQHSHLAVRDKTSCLTGIVYFSPDVICKD